MDIKSFIQNKLNLIFEEGKKGAHAYNTFGAVVNENRLAYWLRGKYDHEANTLGEGRYEGEEESNVKNAQEKLKAVPGLYEEQDKRARAMALAFLKHNHEKGYRGIDRVHVTSKPGQIEAATGISLTQQENPSDLIAKFKKVPPKVKHNFVGLSAKSSRKGKIGFHNGGTETVGSFLGLDLEGMANQRQNEFADEHGLDRKKSVREKQLKADDAKYNYAKAAAQDLHKDIRDKILEGYNKKAETDHEGLRNHILNTYLKASDSEEAIPYQRVSGKSLPGKEATATVEESHDNPVYHALKNAKKISFAAAGNGYIHVMADGAKQFAIQVKHNNKPMASSIKINGQP